MGVDVRLTDPAYGVPGVCGIPKRGGGRGPGVMKPCNHLPLWLLSQGCPGDGVEQSFCRDG